MSNQIIPKFYLKSKYWHWNGFKIAWNVKGEKNKFPMIFIHGFGASSAHWRNNINFFVRKGYAVYTIDLLGFGKSGQPGIKQIGKLDNEVWSNQVTDFIKEIVRPKNSNKIILIGNSLGSLVALTCAVSIPEEIKSIIASPMPDQLKLSNKIITRRTNSNSIKNSLLKYFYLFTPLEIILFLITKLGIISLGLGLAYFKKERIDRQLINIVKRPALRPTAARSLRAMCFGMSTREDNLKITYLLNSLNKIKKIPLLLIWGEKDNFIPLFLGKRIANFYSSVELKIIPNSGHCVHDEDHHKFNKISYQWIKNLNII